MNGLSVFYWFQLSNGDFFIFEACVQYLYKVRKHKITKLGHSVEVRAHYLIPVFPMKKEGLAMCYVLFSILFEVLGWL